MTKRTTVVELYRIKNVASVDNAFSGGKLLLTNHDGSAHAFNYIREAERVALTLRQQIESSRTDKNMTYRENI